MKYNYGLLGEKLSHSYSKTIHTSFGLYSYELIEVSKDKVDDFLKEKNFKGLNVTIPYKQTVIPYCDELSDAAKKIGSVNTIVKREDGSLYGDNTDYFGFLYMAKRAGISFENKKVIILGSGGTSKTASAAVSDNGGKPIIISRSGENNYNNLYLHRDADVIINTTPVGMYPNNFSSAIELKDFPSCEGVIDVIYNPNKTRLILEAEKRGIKNTGGLIMLSAQAKKAAEIFTGKALSDELIEKVYKELKKSNLNITLVGMPGCGKSSLGKAVSKELSRKFIDIDAEIEEAAEKSIPEIFESWGEEGFRSIEAEILSKYTSQGGLVISTGGGAVLKEENRKNIRQNSFCVFVDRDLEKLSTKGRPLSKSLEALKEMQKERAPLYNECANIKIDNNGEFLDTAEKIVEAFYENSGD